MTDQAKTYRLVQVGEPMPDAVTVGIETGPGGQPKAAVWWESKGDIDADEAEFDDVAAAFDAAEASRALHGFDEVVVVVADPALWNSQWGHLQQPALQQPAAAKEPIGDVSQTDLTSNETYELAAGIEAERDA